MVPSAVLMMLDGNFASVPVTTEAFQPPPGSGSTSGSFLVAEHTVSAYLVSSISLPELSRRVNTTSLWYDFTSESIKGISPIDGGYYLPPGFTNQEISIDQSEERSSISLRFQDDDFGHILPVPAGDTVKVTFYSIDGKHVAWSGDLLCSSQSNENLPPSVSLKDLRAIVKFERGAARVLIPESGTNLGVSLLGLFMTIFYLFVIATKLEARLREGAGAVAADIENSPIRLFLLNGPLNAGSSAIGGLIVSSSIIQTVRETIVLVYGFAGFLAVSFAIFPTVGALVSRDMQRTPLTTIRIIVETCLLSAIALPMGIYSKLSQFTSALVGLGLIGVSLRNFRMPSKPRIVWTVDRAFRLVAIGVLAPTIVFPVFVTSSVEYQGSSFLVFPTIVFTLMVATIVVVTGARLEMIHEVFATDTAWHTGYDTGPSKLGESFRNGRVEVLPVLFLVLTVLCKSLIVQDSVSPS